MSIKNTTKNTVIANKVVMADNPILRMVGLIGKKELPQGGALIIKPCKSIHMFFMQFAIDVIFIDKHDNVVGIVKEIQPFGLSPLYIKSACAIELPAGTIEATQTAVGDLITIQ